MADAVPEAPWTEEQITGDSVGKKEIITWLQEHASFTFLGERKLKGALKNVVKTTTKDTAIKYYNELFESKSFRAEGEEDQTKKAVEQVIKQTKKLEVAPKDEGPPKYKKVVLKKGNKINYPARGDTVKCYYKGTLEDGTVFDTNIHAQRRGKIQPLAFKVGRGLVIKGWDEALLTMSLGEKALITIEPAWAYGRHGKEEAKIPPNATLIFEVELMAIE